MTSQEYVLRLEGWDAYYKLRKAVAADKYPALTNIVSTSDAARQSSE